MRIHTDRLLTAVEVDEALWNAQARDEVDGHLRLINTRSIPSESHLAGWKIFLGTRTGESPTGQPRHWMQSQQRFLGTKSEMMWLVAHLFQLDRTATVGPYRSKEEFDAVTNHRFHLELAE